MDISFGVKFFLAKSKTSGIPPTFVATIGLPQHNASAITIPNASFS